MNTEITEYNENKPWLFYDGACGICRGWVNRCRPVLEKNGVGVAPQQCDFARECLGLPPGEIFPELKIFTPEKKIIGGIAAVLFLSPWIWWIKPLRLLAKVPCGMTLLQWGYQRLASSRYCLSGGICKLPIK